MNIMYYMLFLFVFTTAVALFAKLASREPSACPSKSRTDSDRLDEIAARLEKIEHAILNGKNAAQQ